MTLFESIRYVLRVVGNGVVRPVEAFDRMSARLEVLRERSRPRPKMGLGGAWREGLADLIRARVPKSVYAEFEEAWTDLEKMAEVEGHPLGKGYDAGRAMAEGAYVVTRVLRPSLVVETGVARGITTRMVLEALNRNGVGQLVSIDLPPLATGWHDEAGAAVTHNLRSRWTYIRGSSRRALPVVFRQYPVPTLFIHDSLHTYANMMWELRTALSAMKEGGVILCDDVEDNAAFADFVGAEGLPHLVSREPYRTGLIGAARVVRRSPEHGACS